MSVLKSKRTTSKGKYVDTSIKIYRETLTFVSRLSARYSRLIGESTVNLAGKLMEHTTSANSTHITDLQTFEIRRQHLIEAANVLHTLDVQLALCYEVLYQNPQGAFTSSKGDSYTSDKAKNKLDNMAENLGNLIDEENNLLSGVISSDLKNWENKSNSKSK